MSKDKKELTQETKDKMVQFCKDNGDLDLTDWIDVIVETNGIIGVGLISLGDGLKQYSQSKIRGL